MASQTRAIKRRIKSVKNTRKITKAMELVAASKMRKAVSSALSSRPYAKLAWEMVRGLATHTDVLAHPLLAPRVTMTRALVLVVTSDRGLAGAFNTNALKLAFATCKQFEQQNVEVDVICIGRRGTDAMRRAGKNVIASFVGITDRPRFEDVLPVSRLCLAEYEAGTYDRIVAVYTDFISALSQKAVMHTVLPLEAPKADTQEALREYRFEPDPTTVLNQLLPRLVETSIYQAVLESSASEHSARMMAMKNASESAKDMIDDLTLTFNQARQAGITQEIAEISSGKAALESR